MTKARISEFSKRTKVSVRTLHHYDSIGLLSASERQSNGFRLYDKKDFETLQQILALKFLGFELSTVKNLLEGKISATETFTLRRQVILEKIKNDKCISKVLENIEIVLGKVPEKHLLKIVSAYHTLHQIEKKNISNDLNATVNKVSYKLMVVLQCVSSYSTETFLTLTEQILDEIESIAASITHE